MPYSRLAQDRAANAAYVAALAGMTSDHPLAVAACGNERAYRSLQLAARLATDGRLDRAIERASWLRGKRISDATDAEIEDLLGVFRR